MSKNKVISKKSIYLTGINKFKINKKLRKINRDEVLVKVDSCGVCSSDLKFIYTGSRIKKYPIVLGHEISGSIKKIIILFLEQKYLAVSVMYVKI